MDFLQEMGECNSELARRIKASGVDSVREEIIVCMREREEKNPDSMYEWRRIFGSITQLKQKINEFNEEIRKCVSVFGISYEEYNQIMADGDEQKKKEHLIRFLKERMSEIQGTLLASGSLDKQVHQLGSPDAMLTMRKDIYIDQKNIIEALSVMLLDDMHARQIVRSLLDETSHGGFPSQPDQPIEVVFEESIKEMLRILSLIEQYQKSGLAGVRRLEGLDRQVVYMLTAIALQKQK